MMVFRVATPAERLQVSLQVVFHIVIAVVSM
jgi:hypothetical protein